MKAKRIIGKLLMAFVLVSIGFALGREVEKGRSAGSAGLAMADGADKTVVYYMHASFRCVTCNLVESMGAELVRTEFADPVRTGRLEWKPVNYQESDDLAKRYSVGGNMIVVARFRGGKEVEHRCLDRVMELANKRDEFMPYVRGAIHAVLEGKA